MRKRGFQRWSEDMESDHDLETHEAMARDFGSRYWERRRRTSHGVEHEEEEGDEEDDDMAFKC